MECYQLDILNIKHKINLGIEILRMILSFLIVVIHCHNKKGDDTKILLFCYNTLCFYVPTFFIISFYFSFRLFISKDIIKIKQRFKRILIPYIIWPIIFWLRYNIFIIINNIKDKEIIKNLYYQILIGHGFYGVFWFLFNLVFLSLFIIIIIFLFHKKYLSILKIIFLLLMIYNYLGYNNYIFEKFNHRVNHSIKRIPSSLFYSISGFFLGEIKILDKLKNKKRLFFYFLFIEYCIIKDKNKIIINCPYFLLFIIDLVSIILFLLFANIPFDKIENSFIFLFIKQITKYTGGVYYLHPEVRDILIKYIKYRNIKGCILIYLICYFICLFGSILFKKSYLKYLFA